MGSTRRERWCDISTNTLLTEGDICSAIILAGVCISTNTLLTEGDARKLDFLISELGISTNTLLTEGDASN